MVPYDQGLWLALTAPWEIEICTKEGVGPGIPTLEQSLDPVPGDIPEATLPREGPCEAEGRLLAQGPPNTEALWLDFKALGALSVPSQFLNL